MYVKVYVSKSAIVVIYVMKKKNFPPLPNVKILPFYLETLYHKRTFTNVLYQTPHLHLHFHFPLVYMVLQILANLQHLFRSF